MKKMNVLKGIILAAVCGFCIVPAAKADAQEIAIGTEQELQTFAQGKSSHAGDVIYLTDDIELTGKTTNWDTSEMVFTGTFDGRGHTISNMHMSNNKIDFEEGYAGFIANTGNHASTIRPVIKNLTIKDSSFAANRSGMSVGVFVGKANAVDIINCHAVNCTVETAGDAGGIVGETVNSSCKIASCTVKDCELTGGENYTGAILGSGYDVTIYNCANYGLKKPGNASGIAGDLIRGEIKNCLSVGKAGNGSVLGQCLMGDADLQYIYVLDDSGSVSQPIFGEGVSGLSADKKVIFKRTEEFSSDKFLEELNGNRPADTDWLAWEFRSDNMFPVIAKCTDISGADVTLAADEVVYTGDPVNVAVSVKYNGQSLSENTDYELVYENNEEVGEATVRIQGIGLYMGEITRTFTIKEENDLAKIADIRLEKTKYEYTGSEIKPEVTVTVDDEDEDLVEGQDYELVYEDNIEAGEATVTIKGIGKYEGEVVRTFMIEQSYIDLSEALVTLGQTSYEYTGSEIKPELTVTLDEENLTEDTDYKISYSNNIRVGQASVTVTGIGDYTGSITKNFTITEAPNKNTGSTNTGNNSTTNSTTNNTGNTTGSTNTANQNATQINSIVNAGISLNQVTYTYDGNEKKPSITVTCAGRTLISGVDYDVKYSDNVNAGTAEVLVIGKGKYQGTCRTSFIIKKASQKITCGKITIKGRRGKAFSLKTKLTGDGKLTFKSLNSKIVKVTSRGKIILKKSGTVTILVKASGTGNYKAASKEVTLKVICRAAR